MLSKLYGHKIVHFILYTSNISNIGVSNEIKMLNFKT